MLGALYRRQICFGFLPGMSKREWRVDRVKSGAVEVLSPVAIHGQRIGVFKVQVGLARPNQEVVECQASEWWLHCLVSSHCCGSVRPWLWASRRPQGQLPAQSLIAVAQLSPAQQ